MEFHQVDSISGSSFNQLLIKINEVSIVFGNDSFHTFQNGSNKIANNSLFQFITLRVI